MHIGGLFYTVTGSVRSTAGVILEPILFLLYTADLLQLVKRHQLIKGITHSSKPAIDSRTYFHDIIVRSREI